MQGLSINMPKPSNKPSTEKHELKVVQVMPDGAVLINGASVSFPSWKPSYSRPRPAIRR